MLGPFDPLTISAGVLTNLAYDVLKHRAQSINNTTAVKMLKWAGIIEPNFEERLCETLSKTLGLYFKEHPQYALSGIVDFFRDASVAEQIGDYILDRRPIDYTQLQLAFEQHFSTAHPASKILFQRRGLSSKQVINDFITCYRRVIGEQLSVPEMGILLDLLDQTTTTVNEIKASEQRLKHYVTTLLETKLSPTALRAAYQAGQQQLAQDLAAQVQASTILTSTQAATQSLTASRPALFTDGLCRGRTFQYTPDQYFVSHGFDPDTLADWRETIVEAMSHVNITSTALKPYFSGDTIMGGFRLCGICEKLSSARFSLFLLPAIENHNVYLELGIAIGLGAPFFLIQERGAAIPSILSGLGLYTQQRSLLTMRRELAGQVKEYDFGAVRFIKEKTNASTQPQYVIVAGGQFDDEDFEWGITKALEQAYPQRLKAISFSSHLKSLQGSGLMLEQLVETIQMSRFALYRVDERSSPTTFLALGISIGLSRPLLMIHKTGQEVPLDIRGMNTFTFPNFTTLKKELATACRGFFNRYL